MGGEFVLPRRVPCSSTPIPTRPSQQPGHCPESSVLMALPPARRTQVPCPERPWALVLHTKPLQKARRAEGSQVLSSGGGSSWGPRSPLQAHSGSLRGTPLLLLCALPWRAWGRPCPWALPSLLPRPRLLPLPTLRASFVAAGTGGRAPDCRCCSASGRVSELSKWSCRRSYVELLGLALFSSLDKTQSCLSFGLLSSPLAVGHTRSRPVLSFPLWRAKAHLVHCRPQDRRLSVFPFQAVSDTPSLLRPSTLPASWLPQTCSSPPGREDSRCLAGDSVLFSSTDPKPNGFHTFAIVSHVFLLDGKLHKTLTRVPVVAWGTSQLGCCWVAGAPAGPCRCTHVVLPWKSCPGDRSQLLSYLFISKISRCFYEFQEGVPLELPPGLPAPVPPLGPL